MMEIWDLYKENREKTTQTVCRGEPLPDDLFHLVVHVWIKNLQGKWLISQRAANRPRYPLKWECVGGAVCAGENSLQGALREVEEEVGIKLNPEKGKIVKNVIRKVINGKKFNDILDIWQFEYDGDANLSQATTDEVAQTRWVDKSEICSMLKSGEFVPTLAYFETDFCE